MEDPKAEARECTPQKKSDAAFVLGVLSLVFIAVCQLAGLVLGIIGLSKARRARSEGRDADTAWTLCVIGIVLNAVILAIILVAVFVGMAFVFAILNTPYYW